MKLLRRILTVALSCGIIAAVAAETKVLFGRDDVAFGVGSNDLPGIDRFYRGFWEAALESGISRTYGGIHFESANVHGLLTGARTGMYVFETRLRPSRASGMRSRAD